MSQIKTAGEMRGFLAEVMVDIRNGKIKAQEASAISKVAAQINQSISTEIAAAIQLERLSGQNAKAGSMVITDSLIEQTVDEPMVIETQVEVVEPTPADPSHFSPGGKVFCNQCEDLVPKAEADACRSKFCPLKKDTPDAKD